MWFLTASRNEYAKRLGYKEIDFSKYEHMTPPDSPLPYMVSGNGAILRYHVNRPRGPWARFPHDVSAVSIWVIAQLTDGPCSAGSSMPACKQTILILLLKSATLMLTIRC